MAELTLHPGLFLLLPVLAGVMLFVAGKFFHKLKIDLVSVPALALTAGYLLLFLRGGSGEASPVELWRFLPMEFGVHSSIYAEFPPLKLLIGVLVSGVGFFVVLFSKAYFKSSDQYSRAVGWIYLFMASMLGFVMSPWGLGQVIFWELTSLCSFFLIGLDCSSEDARAAARKALFYTGFGGLFLLAGMLPWSDESIPMWAILIACLTKSAQFPFSSWLTGAMVAPTPISTYLHSATMVKLGVLLAIPTFGLKNSGQEAVLIFLGLVTLCLSFRGVFAKETKLLLASLTVGALAMMMILVPRHPEAAMVLLFAHAGYKATLFLSAGLLHISDSTKYVEGYRGLWWRAPGLTVALVISMLSMLGLPLTLGGFSKSIIQSGASPVVIGGVVYSLLVAIGSLRLAREFFTVSPSQRLTLSWSSTFGIYCLSILSVVAPIWSSEILNTVSVFDRTGELVPNTDIVKQILLPFAILVIVTLALRSKVKWRELPATLGMWTGIERLFHESAKVSVRLTQSGLLRRYLISIILLVLGLMIYVMISSQIPLPSLSMIDFEPFELVLAIVIICGALGTVFAPNRLSAIVSLGVVGFGIALVYQVYGAPDLAMTQIFVDILTVLLFVLIFYHMPKFTHLTNRLGKVSDATIAGAFGLFMGLITLIIAQHDSPFPSISEWHIRNSVPEGNGKNIVNVILVDFRGLDTMGEITVLAVAALGVYALLKLNTRREVSR